MRDDAPDFGPDDLRRLLDNPDDTPPTEEERLAAYRKPGSSSRRPNGQDHGFEAVEEEEIAAAAAEAPEFLKDKPEPGEPLSDGRKAMPYTEAQINSVVRWCAAGVHDIAFMRGRSAVFMARIPELANTDGGIAAALEKADAEAAGEAGRVEIDGVRYTRDAALLRPANPALAAWELNERFLFYRPDRRQKGWIAKRAPDAVAQYLVAAAHAVGFRPCSGIARVPILREDGRIIAAGGYDPATGLILDLDGLNLPTLPVQPSKMDATAALQRLLHPFRGYADSTNPAALAAAVLTAVLRPSFEAAPLLAIDGNQPGVGKGKLARALAEMNDADAGGAISEGHDPAELDKRVASALIAGAPVILLDNLTRLLSSTALTSALTEPIVRIRVFGKIGDEFKVSTRALFITTANNAVMTRDLLRRSLQIRIEVPSANPGLRFFGFDPVEEVRRDRGGLIAAALTVARAWIAVMPKGQRELGSYEPWSRVVAGAVEWLTGASPIDLIADKMAEQEVMDGEAPAYNGLFKLTVHEPLSAREIIERTDLADRVAFDAETGEMAPEASPFDAEPGETAPTAPDMHGPVLSRDEIAAIRAAATAAGGKAGVSSVLLGNWLRNRNGTPKHGYRIIRARMERDNVVRWQVLKL